MTSGVDAAERRALGWLTVRGVESNRTSTIPHVVVRRLRLAEQFADP